MLGLADRTRVIDLFEALMKGDVAGRSTELRDQYDFGADPSVVLADLAEFTHFVTRVKIVPAVADDISLGEAERTRGRAFATALSMRVLSRTWQMLLKGIAEVQDAGRPIAAAEMVLVRIAYAADLPTPDEAIRSLDDNGGAGPDCAPRGNGGGAAAASSAPSAQRMRCPARRAARRSACGAGLRARRPRPGRRRSDGACVRCRSPAAAGAGDRHVRGAGGARRRQARPPDQDGAASATCGWCAARTAQLEIALEPRRRQDAGQRSVAQAAAMDRPALDGGGLARARARRR